jgi:hypothetical protein
MLCQVHPPLSELHCDVADTHDHARCKLVINDEIAIAGARVLSVGLMLDKNRVSTIIFELNTSRSGFEPLVFTLKKRFGEQFGKTRLPLLCWQNQVSSLIFFAGEDPPVVVMSLALACDNL